MNHPATLDTSTATSLIFSRAELRAIEAEATRRAKTWRQMHYSVRSGDRNAHGYADKAASYGNAAYLAEDCLLAMDGYEPDHADPQAALHDAMERVDGPWLFYAARDAAKQEGAHA